MGDETSFATFFFFFKNALLILVLAKDFQAVQAALESPQNFESL